MIKGTYVFYEDGKEIFRSENVITKFGKRFLTNYIAGNVSFNSKDLAVGISGSANYPVLDSNSRLGFEFYRTPVNFGSIDIQSDGEGGFTYGVVYKTTLPQDVTGIIKEVGIYPGKKTSQNNYDNKFITDFAENLLWFDSNNTNPGYVVLPAPRIGANLIEWKFDGGDTTSTTKEYKISVDNLDLSGYSVNDSLAVAFNRYDTNSSKIRIKFYNANLDYFYTDIDSSYSDWSGTGDKIIQISMNDVFSNKSGDPKSSSITNIGIEITRSSTASNSYIYFDGIRINDEDTFDPTYGLISRSVLSTPLEKIAGRQVDIEYRLSLGF